VGAVPLAHSSPTGVLRQAVEPVRRWRGNFRPSLTPPGEWSAVCAASWSVSERSALVRQDPGVVGVRAHLPRPCLAPAWPRFWATLAPLSINRPGGQLHRGCRYLTVGVGSSASPVHLRGRGATADVLSRRGRMGSVNPDLLTGERISEGDLNCGRHRRPQQRAGPETDTALRCDLTPSTPKPSATSVSARSKPCTPSRIVGYFTDAR
jgi:hypothetical protein